MKQLQGLRKVIEQRHGGRARHIGSVTVKETSENGFVWDGIVEVFNLQKTPMANRVYAWVQFTNDGSHTKQYVTVLHIPPVVSARAAVKAAIEQELANAEEIE